MVTKLGHFLMLICREGPTLLNCPNLVSVLCSSDNFYLYLNPQESPALRLREFINQNFLPKKLMCLKIPPPSKKEYNLFGTLALHFSFLNCPKNVIIFCRVLKIKMTFINIPSNPLPFISRNSLTNQFYPRKI